MAPDVKTQYSDIAEAYTSCSSSLLNRIYFAEPSFFKVVGNLLGLRVLDLACGDGRLTRMLVERGAGEVIGVDVEPKMIELAKQRTGPNHMILYLQEKVGNMPVLGNFDLVTAGFLFHYAETKEELQRMFADAYKNLVPGGRLVAINQDPDHPVRDSKKYGSSVIFIGPKIEGGKTRVTRWDGENEVCSFDNYFWTKDTYQEAMTRAGFKDIKWHAMEVSPEGIEKFGRDFWCDLLKEPTLAVLEARK